MKKEEIREAFEDSHSFFHLRWDDKNNRYKDETVNDVYEVYKSSTARHKEEIEKLKCCGNCKSTKNICHRCLHNPLLDELPIGVTLSDNWEGEV